MEELPQLDPLERRATLDQATYDRLVPVPGVLAALYASYALAHALGVDADAVRWPVAASTGLTALALLLLHLVRRRGLVPVRRVAWFAAPIVALMLWNCRTHLALTGEPSMAMYFMLVMVGTGLVVLSWPVVVGTTAGAWVGLLSVATFTGPRGLEWQYVGIGLVTATALTVIVHAARIRATVRLAALVAAGRDITRRRQLETSLRHNEAYLRTLIEHSTDTIAVLDVDGTVLARLESADEPIGRLGFAASSTSRESPGSAGEAAAV
jgi:PAS domain-containing protein